MTQQEQLIALLAKYEPAIQEAFLDAVRDITDQAQIGRIITALERGDLEAALRATHIEAPAYQGLESVVRQAYLAGGSGAAETMPVLREATGARVVFRFDVRNPQAERWLSEHSATMVTNIVTDQREAVRAALEEGMKRGDNPRSTALDVVGRVNAVTGRREGGIIGLTTAQRRYVAAARVELASGDPALMRHYLTRVRRDARFDAAVRRAIASGKPLDAATVRKIAGRYSDRLLMLRGETVGRTESMAALNAATMESYRQAVATGTVAPVKVRKVWKATRDARTRDSHRNLDGETVGLEQRFSNGLLYPGDPDGDVSEIANCRCRALFRIDRLSNLE